MIAVIGWTFAGAFFAFWVIEHIGGREKRDDLRAERDTAIKRADELAFDLSIARTEVRLFEAARDERIVARWLETAQPVAPVIPIKRDGRAGA